VRKKEPFKDKADLSQYDREANERRVKKWNVSPPSPNDGGNKELSEFE